eukprot:CAMPEP_0174920200 /NCGR_PEP_ID=MMETSP1355-20121228/4214_1 /TAXON_ID=464990 /ORGANISM="Hemiselmis tepida, Strain CCMP443" /LENGTH=309 /DNA_ID=CAMNT_0016165515 /DNA_START=51 /DNA_END=980 /DNA_ORIENTATION=-
MYAIGALIATVVASAVPSAFAFSPSFAPLLRSSALATRTSLCSPSLASGAMGGTCFSSLAAPPLRKRSVVVLQMADDTFAACKVVSNEEAAKDLRLITVDVGSAISADYKVPGQYVKMRKDDQQEKPGFFAIASAPGATPSSFDFLIKRTDGSSWLCDTAAGGEVEVSTVQGPGYRYAEKFGSDIEEVIVLATGSGIAPLKAAIESKDLEGKRVRLYYGCRTPEACAFGDLVGKWEGECGAEVVQCFSQGGDLPEGARKGYVQAAVLEDGIDNPEKTGVLFCGVNDMVKEAKEALEKAGVKPESMLMNF